MWHHVVWQMCSNDWEEPTSSKLRVTPSSSETMVLKPPDYTMSHLRRPSLNLVTAKPHHRTICYKSQSYLGDKLSYTVNPQILPQMTLQWSQVQAMWKPNLSSNIGILHLKPCIDRNALSIHLQQANLFGYSNFNASTPSRFNRSVACRRSIKKLFRATEFCPEVKTFQLHDQNRWQTHHTYIISNIVNPF